MKDKDRVDSPSFWVVPQAGFCWIEAKEILLGRGHDSGPFLVARFSELCRSYSPFRETGLFKSFAETDPTEEGILLFANKFGNLGEPTFVIPEKLPDFPICASGGLATSPRELLEGVGFSFWNEQIGLMRQCLFLWDAIMRRRMADLRQVVRWRGESVCIVVGNHSRWIASSRHHPERLSQMQRGDLYKPALYYVQEIVNEQLTKREVAPQLLWNRSKLQQFMFPRSLIGALWAQFCAAIDGDREYQTCKECRKWFERGEVRVDAKFCSNACRQRAKRKRRSQARTLATKGFSISIIAKKLNTSSTTVQSWLS
jgi:hypothetical protein